MKVMLTSLAATLWLGAASVFQAAEQPTNLLASAPLYVPNTAHAGEPLPDGVIAWDALLKATDAAADQGAANFVFNFTNLTDDNVTILGVHPSCGCTTAELPPVPWTIPAGSNGQIRASVNLQGKAGNLFKSLSVVTDRGNKNLMLRINILPPVITPMTEADRARGIAAAKVDRQAIFKGECAFCHVKNVTGAYGQNLYQSICAVCHEAPNRATMVPDLHHLTVPTNEEFWRTWITAGKAGSLMPAFASAQGGPLNDMQIASLAAYLNAIIPSHVPVPPGQ